MTTTLPALPALTVFTGPARAAYATALEVLTEDGAELDMLTVADYCAERYATGGRHDVSGYLVVRDTLRALYTVHCG